MSRTVIRTAHGDKRLAWIKNNADSAFWEKHWESLNGADLLRGAASEPSLLPAFLKHIQIKSRVLEAGCGLGQWVELLSRHGMDIIGIDYADKTIAMAHNMFGGNPARFISGDIRHLPFPEASFDAVISLGVIEHFKEGPEELLNELFRVIRPGGKLLVSVPYFNILRTIKALIPGTYERGWNTTNSGEFYQYAFTHKEIISKVTACGLNVIDSIPYSAVKGLTDEIPYLSRLRQKPPKTPKSTQKSEVQITANKSLPRRFLSAIFNSTPVRAVASHMIMIVGTK